MKQHWKQKWHRHISLPISNTENKNTCISQIVLSLQEAHSVGIILPQVIKNAVVTQTIQKLKLKLGSRGDLGPGGVHKHESKSLMPL